MDHGQNVKVSNVQLSPLQRIKISFGCCPCKLYVEQSLLFSLFLKKIIFNVCMLMDVLTFRWVTVIAKYLQSETVADLFYVTCFCNVYAWILIKYKLHFDFLVVFTLLLRPCKLLYHVSWSLYYWSLHFFFLYLIFCSMFPFKALLRPYCGSVRP